MKRSLAFWVSALTLLFFWNPLPSQALTLIPPSFELQIDPGQSTELEVKLYNETQKAIQLYTEVANFTAQGETGQPTFDFDNPSDLRPWFEVESGPFILNPGERREIPIKINAPSEAEAGGHYAALFFSNQPPVSADRQHQIAIGSKLGTLFLINVTGEIIESGAIEELALERQVYNRLPIDFGLRFSNTGTIHLRPQGTLAIRNWFNQVKGDLTVNAVKGATLPQTIRKYDIKWEKGEVLNTDSNFFVNFWREVANEWHNFAFGRYSASVAVTYGSAGSLNDNATVSFWVIPWRLLTVIAVALIILIIAFIFFIKRYNAWIIQKARR